MLTKLTVRNFKSLVDVTVEFPRLAVLFGSNAAGKSNLFDAIAALSGIGNARTLSDVLDRPLRSNRWVAGDAGRVRRVGDPLRGLAPVRAGPRRSGVRRSDLSGSLSTMRLLAPSEHRDESTLRPKGNDGG